MARRWFEGARCAGWAAWLALAVSALATGGCAIHTQGPIKEVAYDFSDRDFYDRAYAPSPKYLETDPQLVVADALETTTAPDTSRSPALPARSRLGAIRRPASTGTFVPRTAIDGSN